MPLMCCCFKDKICCTDPFPAKGSMLRDTSVRTKNVAKCLKAAAGAAADLNALRDQRAYENTTYLNTARFNSVAAYASCPYNRHVYKFK